MASKTTPSSYKMDPNLRLRLKVHLMNKGLDISAWIVKKALEELNAYADTFAIGDFVYKADAPEFVGNQLIPATEEQQKMCTHIATPQIMFIDRSGGGWLKRRFGYEKVQENCAVRRD